MRLKPLCPRVLLLALTLVLLLRVALAASPHPRACACHLAQLPVGGATMVVMAPHVV